MKTAYFVLLFVISRVFGDTGAMETKSVKEGDTVTLNSDVIKGPNDTMLWHFNGIRIALINGEASKSCLYDGEGEQFKDRLEVDYKTGSLIVTNFTAEHAGLYEAELLRNQITGNQQSLNRNRKCDGKKKHQKMSNFGKTIKILIVSLSDPDDTNEEPYKVEEKQDSGKITESTTAGPTRDATTTASVGENESEKRSEDSGLSPGAVAGIVVVGVVLLVAAAVGGVKIYRRRRSRNEAVL